MLRVESNARAIEGPAWVLPGQPERVVTLYLGYGRKRGGPRRHRRRLRRLPAAQRRSAVDYGRDGQADRRNK